MNKIFSRNKSFPRLSLISHRSNVVCLFLIYRYFRVKCLDKQHFLVPPTLNFTGLNRHPTNMPPNHSYFTRIPLVRRKFYSENFCPRTAALWNIFPNIIMLTSLTRVNRYLTHISS